MHRRGGRKTLLPAAGERPAIFLGIGLFPLAFWFTAQSIGFCPLLPPPLVSELMGGSAPVLLCYRQTAKCHWGECSAESRTVSTTHRGRQGWKALHGPGRAKASRSLLSAALANAISCPAEVLTAEIILRSLSLSHMYTHTAFHRITSQPAIALSHPHKAGKYY